MGRGLPEWAGFFGSAADLERFEKAVEKDFKGRGMRVAIEDGRVIPVKPPSQQQWGLSNVGQRCASAKPAEWAAIIAGHFDTILSTPREEELSLSEAAPRLMVRLWDELDLDAKIRCVSREDIPGLRTVLCIDSETSIKSVSTDQMSEWGAGADELFLQALLNVRERVRPSVSSLGPELDALLISSEESFYTAALALEMERLDAHLGKHGAIVGLPTRDAILLAPFNNAGVVQSINNVIAITAGAYRDGPGSVSPRVYWYADGQWVEIPYEATDGGLRVSPPEDLLAVLNGVDAG
jgi:hypothetical protein